MGKKTNYQIAVIGAGAAGLVVAMGAAKSGKKVLLIERGLYGGDCTNFGCIPSKSLIASAHKAYAIRTSSQLGVHVTWDALRADEALGQAQNLVRSIRIHEEPEALHSVGVATENGTASFADPHTLLINQSRAVTADQIVIATGSRPKIPNIPGLRDIPYLTNETIFDLETIPQKLLVLGGGPIGCELAQAFSRLGSQVTLVQHATHLLVKECPEAQHALESQFKREGIELLTDQDPVRIEYKVFYCQDRGTNKERAIPFDQVLVATGRTPSTADLSLEKGNIETHHNGIAVNRYGQTSQKHVWAVGDVAGHELFTHLAESEARRVLMSLLLPWPFKVSLSGQPVPRVTYTDPEVASIGLSESKAVKTYGRKKITTYQVPFEKLDRAITDRREEGFCQIVTKKWSSRILGATVVSPRAGEVLMEISTAMAAKYPLRKLSHLIHPYPTYSLCIRKAADQWLTKTLLGELKKWI